MESRRHSSLNSITHIYQHYRKSIQSNDFGEAAYRLSYLKEQFKVLDLEIYYQRYIERVQHGYYSLFLIIIFLISLAHFLLVLCWSQKSPGIESVVPDLIAYAIATLLSISAIILTEAYLKKHPKLLKIASWISLAFIYLLNMFLPIYHHLVTYEELRGTYTTQIIIACYIFAAIESSLIATILGGGVTLTQIIILYTVTYTEYDLNERVQWAGTDLVYYFCINMMGWYFRYMNEISQRRGFLDRKRAVDTNIGLEDEKKQEDELMTAIIPSSIINEVRMHMKSTDFIKCGFENTYFNKQFIQFHENVTILYADIVNYTQMTTKLKPVSKLVETLNDLFGTFDDASEELRVLRIKFLGDCYYCVSGLSPDRNPNHAEACVDLGLRMIEIIKKVSESRDLQIDMRIGVHTGNTLSGIIGLAKWQYDIWSKDVYIANKMESSGLPGKVHITKQTKDQLKKPYHIVPTNAAQLDDYLKDCNLETFIVSPEPMEETFLEITKKDSSQIGKVLKFERNEPRASTLGPTFSKRLTQQISVDNNLVTNRSTVNSRRSGFSVTSRRRTGFMEKSITRFQEREKIAAMEFEKAIENIHLSKFEQIFHNKDIQPLFLVFRKFEQEISYILLPDPLFKNNLIIELAILACVIILQYVAIPKWQNTTLLSISTLIFLAILLPVSWTQYIYHTWFAKTKDDVGSMEDLSSETIQYTYKGKSQALRVIYQISREITQNGLLRTGLYLLLCIIFSMCIFIELSHCPYTDDGHIKSDYKCMRPWSITQLCCLAIILSFLFLKIHVWLKFAFATLVTTTYSYWIWNVSYNYFEFGESFNYSIDGAVTHIVTIVYLSFTLLLIDRQSDYMHRLDHIWTLQLESEQKIAQDTRNVNRNLLENIVPIHVAENYFSASSRREKIYCEEYTDVAVMFASLINVKFDTTSDIEFLQMINEIIVDFDRILMKKYRNTNRSVEKIKIANLTYMACCGLAPGKGEAQVRESDEYVITLVNFAVDLKKALLQINKRKKLDLKLRIGICNGEVTAGVVGYKKPHYDIWGDTVNMASRMDSTGIEGKIQITENTAAILDSRGIQCEYNGLVYVKGKSKGKPDVHTYFVLLDQQNNLLRKPINVAPSKDYYYLKSVSFENR